MSLMYEPHVHGRTRQTDKTDGRPHTVQLCTRSCCTWPGAARGPAARTGQLREHRASRHRAPRQRAGPTGRGAGGLVPLWPRRMIVTKMVTTRAAKVAMTMVAMAPRRRRWWTRRRWQSSHSSICAQSTSSRERRQRSAKGRESAGACGHGTRGQTAQLYLLHAVARPRWSPCCTLALAVGVRAHLAGDEEVVMPASEHIRRQCVHVSRQGASEGVARSGPAGAGGAAAGQGLGPPHLAI